jgi:hypothetical protein
MKEEHGDGGNEYGSIKLEPGATDEDIVLQGEILSYHKCLKLMNNCRYTRFQNTYSGNSIVMLLANARMSSM